jgi:hypothetical protein
MKLKASVIAAFIVATTLTPAQAARSIYFQLQIAKPTMPRAHHDYAATDILTKAGCKFVAPIDGVVR